MKLERDGQPFLYVIDLDERGTFSVHLENVDGDSVWEASTDDDNEEGEFWPVRDGWMRHGKDISGLKTYMLDLGVIEKGDWITEDEDEIDEYLEDDEDEDEDEELEDDEE